MTHTAVLTLSAKLPYRAEPSEYATQAAADAALAAFGEALAVERVEDANGVRLLVTCADQRGPRGAFRLHSIACGYRVPVHIA
ncbi:MAG TPA: hypothetical protein VK453_25845 [Micromonosporaceae bacterium]|nr:hypothetical protein [Micromonosporaceae bacterium]